MKATSKDRKQTDDCKVFSNVINESGGDLKAAVSSCKRTLSDAPGGKDPCQRRSGEEVDIADFNVAANFDRSDFFAKQEVDIDAADESNRPGTSLVSDPSPRYSSNIIVALLRPSLLRLLYPSCRL